MKQLWRCPSDHHSILSFSVTFSAFSPKRCQCSLPAGGLIRGGGIMGTMMGRLPCSLLLGVEVDGVVEGSVTPFLEAGKDWELLARSGEPSLLSVDAGIFGSKFSEKMKVREIKPIRRSDTHCKSWNNNVKACCVGNLKKLLFEGPADEVSFWNRVSKVYTWSSKVRVSQPMPKKVKAAK